MKILGIFGHPISHSLSAIMHKAAFEAVGLDKEYIYLPFDIHPDKLAQAVEGIRVLNFRGVNITIPHKEEVVVYLDEVDQQARLIGAVNVIKNDKGTLIGYNTDGWGFIKSLEEEAGLSPQNMKVVVLGAGGACRAVSASLAAEGVKEIVIINRTKNRAQSVAQMVKQYKIPVKSMDFSDKEVQQTICDAEIIVNTTSVGMPPNTASPLEHYISCLHKGQLVCDIIYNPIETTLLKDAREKGCRILAGLGMLLYQGVKAFNIWTGTDAPVEVMRKALWEKLYS